MAVGSETMENRRGEVVVGEAGEAGEDEEVGGAEATGDRIRPN